VATKLGVEKRFLDLLVASAGLLVLSPLFLVAGLLIWLQDFRSPLYVAPRVGQDGSTFRMVKFRSMTVGADRTGVDSTSARDPRITSIGRFLRAYKLDELLQLWNVFIGQMSLVGPRPQVRREVDLFTDVERQLLRVKPGITDLSSIVFSDESEILKNTEDPDLAYNQLIRPWKSRLGLLYVNHRSLGLDIELIVLTAFAMVSRRRALAGVRRILERLNADESILSAAKREQPLVPYPPPGALEIVTHR
jgi:lipopolysaccharide/colanic/teichoic acid biosynthesis glycosyltransferase